MQLPLDTKIRCGVIAGGFDPGTLTRQAQLAETGGLDSLWVGDHIAFHVPVMESLSVLNFLAGVTTRVQLGTCVYLLGLRPPVVAAKTAATLDVLSAGRLILGVGVGGEFPPEFEACGVPLAERGSRVDEAIPLLKQLWTQDRVEHTGRHFRFGPLALQPRPVQHGGPPIWVGGRKPVAFARAGKLGDGYISHMVTPEFYRANLEKIAHAAAGRAAQFQTRPFGTAGLFFTVFDKTFEAAQRHAANALGAIYRTPFEDASKRYCLLGTKEDILVRMREFVAAGTRHFIFSPLRNPLEFTQQIAEEILPALSSLESVAAPSNASSH